MATIVTRAGKGSVLSWAEADANFVNLNTDKAEISAFFIMILLRKYLLSMEGAND